VTAVADQPARDRIARTGLGETLFVEAGAGTGKTTELVARVVNLVLQERVRLAGVAAITFTEAAAAELQDRIRVEFEKAEEVAERAGDTEMAERCRQAVADADLAAISTLHGFARRILAEHPVAAGLPPRLDILDEVRSQLAHEDRWDRFVDRLHDDPANEDLLTRAALVGVPLEPRYQGHVTLKEVAADLDERWDQLDALAALPQGPFPAVDFTPFDRAVAEVEALFDLCDEPSDNLCQHLHGIVPGLQALRAVDDPERKLALLAAAPDWGRGTGGRKAHWRIEVSEAKDRITELNAARARIVGDVCNDVLLRLLAAVAAEVREAAEARRREGRLEFHDLLVLARRLLRTSPTARRALHERYTHLLLDEFQDTDPIQIEIAVQIAAAVDGEPPAWEDTEVPAGRLFFVGDPKQSIYRFRRADIELFLRARDRFAPDGTGVALQTNFRTVPSVLAWVNGVFDRLMHAEVAGRQPRYQPLDAHRDDSPTADHRPVLLGEPHEKVRAPELRILEATSVARTIDAIRARPEEWPVHDRDDRDAPGRWRHPTLADVTILVPTRTSLPYLREALDERGIPYRLDTGTLVYDTQEVRDLLAVLRAVDDPTDELSLVAALRSPLYACADTDLFTYRHAGGRWDLRKDPPETLAGDHPVVAACAHLRALWERRWWSSPSSLLQQVVLDRHAFVLAFGERRYNEVWRRLRFLLDQARVFEESGGGGLRAFVEWAELQRSEGARVHEPLLPERDDVAVRILTVHGAKGLEFPITILSGMTTRPGNARSGVQVIWDRDDDLPSVALGKKVSTANHDPRADIELEMDEHEKLRLLYVACTRARDHLVIACHHNAGDRSYANRVWDLSATEPGTWRRLADDEAGAGEPGPQPPAAAPPPADDRDEWVDRREALLGPQRTSRFVSATTLARSRLDDDRPDDDTDPEGDLGEAVDGDGDGSPMLPRRRGRAGTAIGRAVHATLQLTDLAHPVDIDEQAARQAELEAVPDLADTVAAMVRSALDSAAVAAAVAGTHHKELYVAAPVGRRVIEGYIDLLVETPDGLVIVDYKTDTVRSESEVDEKLATYEVQGGAYAVGLEEATGLPVVDCRFVFCRPGGAIERSVTDLDAVKRRVRELADRP
jgi:ATP-dependent helicase/nuclease subunit A